MSRLSSRRLSASLAALAIPLVTVALLLAPASPASASLKPRSCPAGTSFDPSTGQCVGTTGTAGTTTSYPATPTCPTGTTFSGGACTGAPTTPGTCVVGIRVAAGCDIGPAVGPVCIIGTNIGGRCIIAFTTPPTCPAGTTYSTSTGQCSGAPTGFTCPSGGTLSGQSCVTTTPGTRSSFTTSPTCGDAETDVEGFCLPSSAAGEGSLNDEVRDNVETLGQPGGTTVSDFIPGNGGFVDSFLPDGG